MLNQQSLQSGTHEVSHNLLGQRLGRKGQKTRERILSAALRLLESPQEAAITLTSVAREAEVGMTALYPYFPDIGDLVLAALMRVMDAADVAFMDRIRTRWPDETLDACILDFLKAHYQFWQSHARLLHMRNRMADAGDVRFIEHRDRAIHPLHDLLVFQMDGKVDGTRDPCVDLATVLLIGFERVVTVVTNPIFHTTAKNYVEGDEEQYIDHLMAAETRLMEMAIRQQRNTMRR